MRAQRTEAEFQRRNADSSQDFVYPDIPPEFLAKVILDDAVHVDVCDAGAMVGTGLTHDEALAQGKVKNHWQWHVIVPDTEGPSQIAFGLSFRTGSSVGSNEAQYSRSSDSDRDAASVSSSGSDSATSDSQGVVYNESNNAAPKVILSSNPDDAHPFVVDSGLEA